MAYLDTLQTVLAHLGGGDSTPESDLSRHLLSTFMWLAIVVIAKLVAPIHKSSSDGWLIRAVYFALFSELFAFIVKVWGLIYHYGAEVTPTPYESLLQPLLSSLSVLSIFYLSLAMIRHVGSKPTVRKLNQVLVVGTLLIVVMTLIVMMHWLSVVNDPITAHFKHSEDRAVLKLVCILLLFYATWQLWALRSESRLSQLAWIPFALYAVAQLSAIAALATHPSQNDWLFSIYGNLMLWTIPVFGYLYLQDLQVQHQRVTQELYQADRLDLVGRLAAGIAHDFNNHLQSILGFAELGLMRSEDHSRINQARKGSVDNEFQYQNIVNSVHAASDLVKQLMAFNKDDSKLDVRLLSLEDFLDEFDSVIRQLVGPSITVHKLLDAKADLVRVDRSILEQVLVNVVVSARDAMPIGGAITISSRSLHTDSMGKQCSMIRLKITDTGKGMTTFEKKCVFEPFLATTDQTIHSGTGLGLLASLAAVRWMGGDMHVESMLGKGSTLIIDLPAGQSHDAPTIEANEAAVSLDRLGGSEHILLVEDELGLRRITSMQLKRAGYTLTAARDDREAIGFLESNPNIFDILILDISMPCKDGHTVFEAAQKLCPRTPVVLISASVGPQATVATGQPKLIKPVSHIELLNVVRQTLDRE